MKSLWLLASPFAMLMLLLIAAAGCTTPQPKLKPEDQPEVFRVPPDNMNGNYPKQAFNDDSNKRSLPDLTKDPGLMRAGGPSMVSPGGGNFGGPMR
jgi:hypothetical protein